MPDETGAVAADPDAALDTMFDEAAPSEPAAETPAGEPAEPTEPPSDAKPRDEKGRFTKPDAQPAEDSPEAPPTEQDAEPEAPEQPEEAAEDVDLSTFPSFQYRANGETRDFAGAFEGNGEVLFTAEAVPALKQKLALADAYPAMESRLARESHATRVRADAAEKQIQAVFEHFEQLAQAGPDAAWEWWQGVAQNWPTLQAKAEAIAARHEAQSLREQQEEATRAQQDAAQVPQMRGLVEDRVRRWGTEAGLDQATQDRLIRRFHDPQLLDQLFPRAQADDPVSGLRKGDRIGSAFEPLIAQEIGWLRDLLKDRTPAAPKPPKVPPKPAKVPPTVSAGKAPAPKASPKLPQFKSAAEADEYIFGEDHFKDL